MSSSVQSRQTNFWGIVVFSFLTVLLIPHITYAADDLYVSSCSPSCSTSNTVVSGTANGTVYVYIIADFPQAEQGVDFNITYDPTVLTYSGVSNGSAVSAWAPPYSVQVSSSGNTAIENFQLGASSPSGAVAPGSGTLQVAKITFTVNSSPSSGSSVLNLSNASFVNVNYTSPPAPTLTNGTFTLNSTTYTISTPADTGGGVTFMCGGSSCTSPVNAGTSVTFTATPNSGYVFGSWGGGSCSGTTNPCTLTINANTTVTATFTPTYTITTTPGTGGSIAFTCGGSACTSPVNAGTSVTFTATPNSGYVFGSWGGGSCSGTTNPCTITINGNTTVTAAFTPTYTVSIPSLSGGSITCGNNQQCPVSVNSGTPLIFTATPDSTHVFGSWGDACSSVGTTSSPYTCNLTITGNTTVSATFTPAYTITTTPGTGGGITYNCEGSSCTSPVNDGTSVTFTANPDAGYAFVSWGGGSCSGSSNPCTITITADTTVTAAFTPTYTITTTPGSGGGITFNCGGSSCTSPVNAGTSVTFTATSDGTHTFASWGGACAGTTNVCTLTINANTTVTATFALKVPSNIINQPSDQTVTAPAPATFTVTPGGNPAPITYEWKESISGVNGGAYADVSDPNGSGANTATYTIGSTTLSENGNQYECVVSNGIGSPATTTPATLTVQAIGVCGSAAQTYAYSATTRTLGQLCATGALSGPSPAFPAAGKTVSWTCSGINGGANISCTAVQKPRTTAPFRW